MVVVQIPFLGVINGRTDRLRQIKIRPGNEHTMKALPHSGQTVGSGSLRFVSQGSLTISRNKRVLLP